MALYKSLIAGVVLGAAAIAAVTWHLDGGDVFSQPAPTAIERLRASKRVVEGSGLGSLTLASAGQDKDALLIGVAKAGAPGRATCRVTIQPIFSRWSRARTDCTPPGPGHHPMRGLAAKAMTIVMREHVAASVGDRAYDIDRVAGRMIAFAVVSAPVVVATMPRPPK